MQKTIENKLTRTSLSSLTYLKIYVKRILKYILYHIFNVYYNKFSVNIITYKIILFA